MTDINPEVRASLTDAGIGPRYHDMQLADIQYGPALLDYLKQYGTAIRREGHSIAFHSLGLTEQITMLCRGLHINGVGCRITPLVRMGRIMRDAEFREIVTEIDVLVIMAGQDSRRGNPLQPWVMAEVEHLLIQRIERKQSTFIHFAIHESTAPGSLDNCYWSDEFMDMMDKHFDYVTVSSLAARIAK